MKHFVLVALLLAFSFGYSPKSDVVALKSPLDKQHAAAHRIGLTSVLNAVDGLSPNAHCSATAVGPNALLTAGHCVTNTNLLYIDSDKNPTTIIAEIPDGADHVIYLVDRTFSDYTPVAERPLVAQEPVHFWGNPGHTRDVYHDGFFVGMKLEAELSYTFQLFTLPAFGGDSGSGIMDANGNVVAIVSLGDTSFEELSLPLSFTAKQLEAANVKFTIEKPQTNILSVFLKH